MTLSTIASITYNADGSIADVDAHLEGDRNELIAGAIKQLSIIFPDADPETVAAKAAADVDVLLSFTEPEETPVASEGDAGESATSRQDPVSPSEAPTDAETPVEAGSDTEATA